MSKHVIVIGAVATGAKAASRLKRLDPSIEVLMVDESEYISFGGCGIPYYISGEINSLDTLRSTAYGAIRDPEYFQKKGITTLNKTRALSIDRQNHTVTLKNLRTNEEYTKPYDQLVIATGSKAKNPPIEGQNLNGVTTVTNLETAQYIHDACSSGKVHKAVIIGGSFIGLEMAVALADMWGIKTSVVEYMPQIMPAILSPDLADMLTHDLQKHDVDVFTSEKVLKIEGKNNTVTSVITNKQTIEAELVIFAVGFSPETTLAREAGLAIDPGTGAILVDTSMKTSDPDIYAGGDCVAVHNPITGKPICLALGSLANRQGRVIGTNIAGGKSSFNGAVGSWCVKVFELSACGVGLTLEKAKAEGFDAISATIEQGCRAHFYPENEMISLELIVDRPTRRVLGIQGVSIAGDALKARIDAVATMLQFGIPTIDDLANAEVSYAPPFASAMDCINTVANVADNILSKQLQPISSKTFTEMWHQRKTNNVFFADARPLHTSKELTEKYPNEWHSLPLENLSSYIPELPKDRTIALICNTGLRAYEVMLQLRKAGINNTVNALGGVQALNKRGEEL